MRGPFDHDVPVLKVANASGGLMAVLFGYACHATVLDGYEFCGDYPGFAQAELQREHPGSVALFFAGCGGDQNPLPRRKVDLARQYGRDLANAVADVLTGKMETVIGELKTSFVEVPLDFASVPTKAEIEAAIQSPDRYVSARAAV